MPVYQTCAQRRTDAEVKAWVRASRPWLDRVVWEAGVQVAGFGMAIPDCLLRAAALKVQNSGQICRRRVIASV
jgi:hypothetical protein